ncbi:MAG: glycosyltransferase family 2 protein [Cognaticolwellia sp.]
MTETKVTVVITPRDRYSGVIECIENLYKLTPEPFLLKVLDLAYPEKIKQQLVALLAEKDNAELIEMGLIIPIEAMRNIRDTLTTPYVMFLDNDSNVTPNWLAPLLEVAEVDPQVAVVNPLTLEKAGVDIGAPLRNHLFTNEITVLEIEGTDYLIEEKHFRRALPEDIPKKVVPSEMFELHGVLFNTKILQEIELPQMVIREHIDIAMQLKKLGYKVFSQPNSVVVFDNLGTRMELADMKFFFFRWGKVLTWQSSRLFEQRWGYNFYAEQAMYHWVFRRRVFLYCRWLHIPIYVANQITRVLAKIKTLIKPVWDPVKNPGEQAINFFENKSL